jgi:hypothetical protein
MRAARRYPLRGKKSMLFPTVEFQRNRPGVRYEVGTYESTSKVSFLSQTKSGWSLNSQPQVYENKNEVVPIDVETHWFSASWFNAG